MVDGSEFESAWQVRLVLGSIHYTGFGFCASDTCPAKRCVTDTNLERFLSRTLELMCLKLYGIAACLNAARIMRRFSISAGPMDSAIQMPELSTSSHVAH